MISIHMNGKKWGIDEFKGEHNSVNTELLQLEIRTVNKKYKSANRRFLGKETLQIGPIPQKPAHYLLYTDEINQSQPIKLGAMFWILDFDALVATYSADFETGDYFEVESFDIDTKIMKGSFQITLSEWKPSPTAPTKEKIRFTAEKFQVRIK